LLESEALSSLFTFDWTKDVSVLDAPARQVEGPLVEARGLTVRYGDCVQFAPFDWKLEAGEHTRIVGPNGSGKSTLLGLITGDHPQCYANDLNVVGYKRGSGESIWDLKKHIGYFSPALHRDYRVSATALTVVISGFFDSIGLYQQPTKDQIALAKRFLDLFDLVEAADTPLHALSFGHQRLVLAARALVKRPPLLILDEPTQGLDALNAALVFRYVERLAQQGRTTLLFVSHRVDEVIAGVDRILRFVPSTRANTRYEVVASRVVGGETDAAYVKKPEFAQNVLGV
jgi:molybdate transport system ATP-binding protein